MEYPNIETYIHETMQPETTISSNNNNDIYIYM